MRWNLALAVAVGIAGATASPVSAQIVVRLRTDHARRLLYEPIPIRVRVENGTKTPLVFSGEAANAELQFEVEKTPGEPARRTDSPLFDRPFVAPAYGHEVFSVDLLRLFDLRSSGPLSVAVRVRHAGEEFYSGKLLLDVVPGLEIARVLAVLPREDAGRRSFQLRTLSRAGREQLFLRVDDVDREICRGVFDLGTLIRQRNPQMMLDGQGRLHVLHQSAPARLTRAIYHDEDRTIEAEYYGTDGAGGRLVRNEINEVEVKGVAPYIGDPVIAPLRGERAEPRADRPDNRPRR